MTLNKLPDLSEPQIGHLLNDIMPCRDIVGIDRDNACKTISTELTHFKCSINSSCHSIVIMYVCMHFYSL